MPFSYHIKSTSVTFLILKKQTRENKLDCIAKKWRYLKKMLRSQPPKKDKHVDLL